MDRWASFAGQTAFFGEDGPDALAAAQPGDPVVSDGEAPNFEFVGDEPVPERGAALNVI